MNCDHLTIVVQENKYRFVSYCEHGTIHLHWDFVTFHLYSPNFKSLVDLLKRIRTAPMIPPISEEKQYKVIRQENNYCQLWLDEASLLLNPTDILHFADLVINAWHSLCDQRPQLSRAAFFDEDQVKKEVSCYISYN